MLFHIRSMSIPEMVLVFNLLFIFPMLGLLILRLRKYEALYGPLQAESKKKGKKGRKNSVPASDMERSNPAAYSYHTATFLDTDHLSCLEALQRAVGPDKSVYPMAALWEWIEPSDPGEEAWSTVRNKRVDFLICDRYTGQARIAVLLINSTSEEDMVDIQVMCESAGASLSILEMDGGYDEQNLRQALGMDEQAV